MQLSSIGKVILLASIFSALIACGGGGSKLSTTASSSSQSVASSFRSSSQSVTDSSHGVSSSSPTSSFSSAASSSLAACTASKGDIFFDEVCSGWQNVSVFELISVAPYSFREIRDGSPGDLVTQKIIDSGIAGRGRVLDIRYNANSPLYGGVVRMYNLEAYPDGVDMSEYATGKLVFDLNVISRGNENANLEVMLECGWPCNSHEYIVPVPQLNQWHTVELPVKDFIADGLDIEHVTTGFLIQAAWGHQANVHFQVDNVRWVKGEVEPAVEAECYANHMGFNDWDNGNNAIFIRYDFLGLPIDTQNWLSQSMPNMNVWPQWSLVSDPWGIAISEPSVAATQQPLSSPSLDDCVGQGTLSAKVYLPASYVADGKLKVGLYLVDNAGNTQFFGPSVSAADMTPDAWTTISVDLDAHPAFNGVASHTGVFFDPNGISPTVTGAIAIDNFVIKHRVAP